MRHRVTIDVDGDGRISELVERFCQELLGREQTILACAVTQMPVPRQEKGKANEEAKKG